MREVGLLPQPLLRLPHPLITSLELGLTELGWLLCEDCFMGFRTLWVTPWITSPNPYPSQECPELLWIHC